MTFFLVFTSFLGHNILKTLWEIFGAQRKCLKLEMNRRETVSPGEQLGITLSQVLHFNCVNYTRIVLKS